jgi:hypothetical protein
MIDILALSEAKKYALVGIMLAECAFSEEQKLVALGEAIGHPHPFVIDKGTPTAETRETLEVFEVVARLRAEISPEAFGAYVTSVTHSASHVDSLYLGQLGRAPDAGGYQWWQGHLDQGLTVQGMIDGFMQSPEYHNRFLPAEASAELGAGQDMPGLALIGQPDSADPGLAGSFV